MKKEYADPAVYLSRAVALAVENVRTGGGPFGAVIVKDGQIIAEATNQVVQKNDPTAHAEVEAIRRAAAQLEDFQLEGCRIYASCEPCPMCLGAIYWAGLEAVYFASTRHDAENAGFGDAMIYREMDTPLNRRRLPTIQLKTQNAGAEFQAWDEKDDRVDY